MGSIRPSAPVDPDTGAIVRAYNVISADVAPDGTAYVAWNEISSVASSVIDFSRSIDGGKTWSAPRAVAKVPAQAFIPTIAVDGDGTVGVTYDDFRNDVRGDKMLSTDVWFSHSHDGGQTWQEIHVAGPFDLLTGPETESSGVAGLFVGDYQALEGLSTGFVSAFAVTRPLARAGPSDVYVARMRV